MTDLSVIPKSPLHKCPDGLNPFSVWCRSNRFSTTTMAMLLDVTEQTINRWCQPLESDGYYRPSNKAQREIFLLTHGAVTPNDMAPLGVWRVELASRAGAGKAPGEVAA